MYNVSAFFQIMYAFLKMIYNITSNTSMHITFILIGSTSLVEKVTSVNINFSENIDSSNTKTQVNNVAYIYNKAISGMIKNIYRNVFHI